LTETEPPTTEIAAMHKRVILAGAFESLAMVELPHTAHRSPPSKTADAIRQIQYLEILHLLRW